MTWIGTAFLRSHPGGSGGAMMPVSDIEGVNFPGKDGSYPVCQGIIINDPQFMSETVLICKPEFSLPGHDSGNNGIQRLIVLV